MKAHFLFLSVFSILISCSGDDEILYPKTEDPDSQEDNLPLQPKPDIGALELPGFPKSIKKYQNGVLKYWAQYYYRPDGKLYNVNYSYPQSSSEVFTDKYQYNSEGILMKIDGHDVYNFYWQENQIVEADKYNGMWTGRSKIFYEYNSKGQIVQKTENYLDFSYSEKIIYTYFEDGNLKTIEQYWDTSEIGVFTLYFITNFNSYTGDRNMFPELEIIPGQIAQHYFPFSMEYKHLTESGYDVFESYSFKYDSKGRVIEKEFGNSKVVYQYY